MKVVISGATSGIGREVAKCFIRSGCTVGVMGRREELLMQLKSEAPSSVYVKVVDVNREDAREQLFELVEEMGGMDVYFHSSGVGYQNVVLDTQKEMDTVETNCVGFTRMVTAAFSYFVSKGEGRIAAITSIAGTRGLGAAPAYSSSKRFQSHYLQCLSQMARIRRVDVRVTDIRPGFVATDLLKDCDYPFLMRKEYVANIIYKAILRHRRAIVIDWRYSILVFFWRLMPRYFWERWRVASKKSC